MSGTLTDKKRTGAPHGVQSSVIEGFLRTFPGATRSDPSRIVRSLQACTSYHRPFFRRSDRRPVTWRDQLEVPGTNASMRGLAVGSSLITRRSAVSAPRMGEARSSRLAVESVHRGHSPRPVSDGSRHSKSGDRVVPCGPHGHAQANDDQPCSCRCVKSGRGSQAKTEGNQDVVKVTRELLYAEKESFVEGCGHERLPLGRIRVPF